MRSVNNIKQPVTSARNKIIHFLHFSFLFLKIKMMTPRKKPQYWNMIWTVSFN